MKRDARKWFQSLNDKSINSLETCQSDLFDKWMEKKYVYFLLGSLTKKKRNENETIDEFDNMFDNIMKDILQTH
jgi:hypothetical protein